MGNHNILITTDRGDKYHQFKDNVSRDDCEDWLEEFGPAPIGFHYQIINLGKKPKVKPLYTLVIGYKDTNDGYTMVDSKKARVTLSNNKTYSLKEAKRDLRALGSQWFTTEKVWDIPKA